MIDLLSLFFFLFRRSDPDARVVSSFLKASPRLSQKYYRSVELRQDSFNYGDFKILNVVEITFRPTFGTARVSVRIRECNIERYIGVETPRHRTRSYNEFELLPIVLRDTRGKIHSDHDACDPSRSVGTHVFLGEELCPVQSDVVARGYDSHRCCLARGQGRDNEIGR